MNIEDKKIAIIAITTNGKKIGLRIKSKISTAHLYYVQKDAVKGEENIIYINKKLSEFVSEIFDEYDYIIFIMSCGIVVRTIAPLIENKFVDPAILVSDEKGKNIISLLSGHIGGANEMALYISDLLNSNPVITTATDVNNKSSLDMIAKKLNAHIYDFRNKVLKINSMLVNDEIVNLFIDGNYDIDTRGFNVCKRDEINNLDEVVVISNKKNLNLINNNILKFVPKNIVIGIGCRKNTDKEYMINSLFDFLHKQNIDINSIKEIGSIDTKKEENALINLSTYLNVPFRTFTVEEISSVENLYEKSDWVKQNVGVYSVAEPVAHLLSDGNLIIKKHKYNGITFSVGRINI